MIQSNPGTRTAAQRSDYEWSNLAVSRSLSFSEKSAGKFVKAAWTGKATSSVNLPHLAALCDLVDELVKAGPLDPTALIKAGIAPMAWFDFDGTLVDESSGDLVRRMFLSRKMALPGIRPLLDDLMKEFNVPMRSGARSEADLGVNTDADRLFEAYSRWANDWSLPAAERAEKTGLIYEFYSTMYAGHRVETLRELAQEAFRNKIAPSYFSKAKEMVQALQAAGIEVGVISATSDIFLREFVKPLGLKPQNIAGMPIAVKDGVVQPYLQGPRTYREGKVSAGMKMIKSMPGGNASVRGSLRPLIAGGDSPSKTDQHLLEAAAFALVIEPQTADDQLAASRMAAGGKPVMLVDVTHTVSGRLVETFDPNRAGELSSARLVV